MPFDLQPILENEWVKMRPLKEDDFEELYKVASDPLIWEQHPSKTRYQREVFQNYFKGAIESGGAFAVYHVHTNEIIGCTRFYDYDKNNKSVLIGYTFIARHCWGRHYNRSMKNLMLDHSFQFVDKVIFHVGENNMRSRKAMEKLGGKLVGTAPLAYYGEIQNINCIYEIDRERWIEMQKSLVA
ncbi:MAG: GNAT family N-acetyltransferase [Sphingobacteriales bacterium]